MHCQKNERNKAEKVSLCDCGHMLMTLFDAWVNFFFRRFSFNKKDLKEQWLHDKFFIGDYKNDLKEETHDISSLFMNCWIIEQGRMTRGRDVSGARFFGELCRKERGGRRSCGESGLFGFRGLTGRRVFFMLESCCCTFMFRSVGASAGTAPFIPYLSVRGRRCGC